MPNWAEGTLKVRGNKDNIIKFLKEGILGYPEHRNVGIDENGHPIVNYTHREVKVTEDEWETDIHCDRGFYINETRRAFIEEECIQFYHDYDASKYQLEILGFKQAWAASPENFIELSKKYEIDFKIFTFEMGMEFTQEIEIIDGQLTKDLCKEKFSDYFWDVAFSTIGG